MSSKLAGAAAGTIAAVAVGVAWVKYVKSQAKAVSRGTWSEHRDIDMCNQGDAEIIPDWKPHKTIEELKRIVEEKNYSAITVSAGEPSFGHAALKNFKYQLKAEHCKSTTSKYPCTIYIYTPNDPSLVKPSRETFMFPADPSAPVLSLVAKGSAHQLIFEHASTLAEGGDFVPLTLTSPKGMAIVNKHAEESTFYHFHLIRPAVGAHDLALHARLEDGFLTRKDNGFVFDVDKWRYDEGNSLWTLKEHDDPKNDATRKPDGGRSFKVNLSEGTISPVKAPGLVLGLLPPKIVLVPRNSDKRCIFEHADALQSGECVPLTLVSPGAGSLAISVKTEAVQRISDFMVLLTLSIGQSADAIHVKYEDQKYLVREKIVETTTHSCARGWQLLPPKTSEYSMVFDVAHAKMAEGSELNILQHIDERHGGTKDPENKARVYTIHSDGCISPTAALDLVLGVDYTCIW